MGEVEGEATAPTVDVWSELRFDAERGMAWLGEHRMLLMHARAFGAFRSQLIASLGKSRAAALITRMGFDSGAQDARLARMLVGEGRLEDVFLLGPKLHSLEGVGEVEIVFSDLDLDRRTFRGEFNWSNSWESESHIEDFGIGSDCTCWMQVGYASGYITSFLGRPVYFRETRCRSKGDPVCTIAADTAFPLAADDQVVMALQPDDIAGELQEMAEELEQLKAYLSKTLEPGALIGRSASFLSAFNLLQRAAGTPITVLLLGETGVGKEMFARWLHDNSARAERPFVAVNCGAIPPELIESELFGVEVGAFTGAQKARPGRFERADGGTLFLDEVGEMPLSAQVKLLRALQTGEVERLGATSAKKVDVRIVAATNVHLHEAVADKRFRSDLFYRLNPYPIAIPPLRDRKDDIPLFVESAVERLSKSYGKVIHGVSDRALNAMTSYFWPGNIRELENVMERGVLLTPPGGYIELESLFFTPSIDIQESISPVEKVRERVGHAKVDSLPLSWLPTDLNVARFEEKLVKEALSRAEGVVSEAAKSLGWTRRQLDYWLKRQAEREP